MLISLCEQIFLLTYYLLLILSFVHYVKPNVTATNELHANSTYHQSYHLIRKPRAIPSYTENFCVVSNLLCCAAESDSNYDYQREYSPKLENIYSKYLKHDFYNMFNDYHELSEFSHEDFDDAFRYANKQIQIYEDQNRRYLASDPRGHNFSSAVFASNLQAKYNEFLTERLTKRRGINKVYTAAVLPSIPIPPHSRLNPKFCNINKPHNPDIVCNSHVKYRRIDGKCNNLKNANWGSAFFCHRRLLPPDYADGILEPRRAKDDSVLPSPRLITKLLMPDIRKTDPKRSVMNMIWGQFMVHDVVRTIQNLGIAIDCCRDIDRGHRTSEKVHPECFPIVNFPPESATIMANNQKCINTVRSTACNTCSLGPRNQMSAATPYLDLSHVYGGNLINNSWTLRSFKKGRLRVSLDLKGKETLPVRNLPRDQDPLDLTPCNERLDRPELTCFLSGDGMRANQNPFVNSVHIMMQKRHNQHADALSRVNPHWHDEIIFQEARRILIAEANCVNFGEYMPSILGAKVMDYFDLQLSSTGRYTKYNSKLDPSSIQAVAVAALRFGHSQVVSKFRVLHDSAKKSYSVVLREKFFELSDVWFGNAKALLRGLVEDRNNNVDLFITTDVRDFLVFNPRTRRVADLPAININRGREHGVAGYVNYLHYCTGAQIKSWTDLHQFIPAGIVNKMKRIYRHYRDIDLFVGGLAEYQLHGSVLGPTFACLNGIQFYHWKYGDRYYFEHGSQAGSFSLAQLNEIRAKTSLASLLCKVMNFGSVQKNVMFLTSKRNPKVSCQSFHEINYNLWRDH